MTKTQLLVLAAINGLAALVMLVFLLLTGLCAYPFCLCLAATGIGLGLLVAAMT